MTLVWFSLDKTRKVSKCWQKYSEIFSTHCYSICAEFSVSATAGTPCSDSGEAPGTQSEAVPGHGGGVAVDGVDLFGVVDGVDVEGDDDDNDTPRYLQDGVGGR